MRCDQQLLTPRFAFDRSRFEAFAEENFGCAGGAASYALRHQAVARGAAPEVAMLVAEARLAHAISGPHEITFRVHAVGHNETIVVVGAAVGGGSPQIASEPCVVHSARLATLEEQARTVAHAVKIANALLPYHRRLLAARERRCVPDRRRRCTP